VQPVLKAKFTQLCIHPSQGTFPHNSPRKTEGIACSLVVYFPPSAAYRKDMNYETPHYIISAIPLQYII
jgi:hypothetical protein